MVRPTGLFLGLLLALPIPPVIQKPLIAEGRLVAVYADPRLFRRADRPGTFIMQIWIENRTAGPVGLDEGPLHINQWVESPRPTRQAVDERTVPLARLTPEKRAWLHQRMRSGGTVLPPGSSLQMDLVLEGGGKNSPAHVHSGYVIIAFDGALFATDGKTDEVLNAKVLGSTGSDLSVPAPVQLVSVPAPPPVGARLACQASRWPGGLGLTRNLPQAARQTQPAARPPPTS